MNSKQIAQELSLIFKKYQLGLLSTEEAKEQTNILQAMLRAYEQAEIEQKLQTIEAVLEVRDNGN